MVDKAWFLHFAIWLPELPRFNSPQSPQKINLYKITKFVFDSSSLKTEIAKLGVIVQEKVAPIEAGFADYDSEFPKVLEELKVAGLDKYVAEFQKQFSEWYAAQN